MVKIDRSICDNCGTCVTVCPHSVLKIIEILETGINQCTDCGRCVQVCPFGAIIPENPGTIDDAY